MNVEIRTVPRASLHSSSCVKKHSDQARVEFYEALRRYIKIVAWNFPDCAQAGRVARFRGFLEFYA